MVGGLSELMENAHLTPGLSSSRKNCQTELLATHSLRTAESKEYAPRSNLLYGAGIEPSVAYQRVAQGAARFGKRRRVNNY